jgi:hypothetical protein
MWQFQHRQILDRFFFSNLVLKKLRNIYLEISLKYMTKVSIFDHID